MRSRKGKNRTGKTGEVARSTEAREALKDLQRIPGVGPSIAGDLFELGIRSVADLSGRDPDELYAAHCAQKGERVDRCWLYVARCAVYFASRRRHDPEKLKWWAWKDWRDARWSSPGGPRRRPMVESRKLDRD